MGRTVIGHARHVVFAVQRGLALSLPLMFLGVFFICLKHFPSDRAQGWFLEWSGGHWPGIADFMIASSYEIVALTVLCGIAFTLARRLEDDTGAIAAMNTILSLAAFVMAQEAYFPFGGMTSFRIEVGLPIAILMPIVTTYVFRVIRAIPPLRPSHASVGFSPAAFDLLPLMPAALVTLMLLGIVVFSLGVLLPITFSDLLRRVAIEVFVTQDQPLLGAGLLILASQILWLFGIHGPAMLFQVREDILYPMGTENVLSLSLGAEPLHIVTNQFVNAFTHIGGSGSTLCLIIAILWVGRDKGTRRLSLLCLLPAAFNVNGPILFGIPIAYNPVYAIPFILTPLVQLVTAYGATALDLVPRTMAEIHWSTPPFLSGQIVTGSPAGTVLQVVNLILGVGIYLPFVRLSERLAAGRVEGALQALNQRAERTGPVEDWKKCLNSPGMEGHLARSLAEELLPNPSPTTADPLALAYQPQVSTKTGEVVGVEALLRWRSPSFGFIPPPTIIALSEDTNQVDALGLRIFERACADFAPWLEKGLPPDFTLSVNISPRQLTAPDLAERVLALTRTHGIPAHRLEVEITESMAIGSSPEEYRNIHMLHDHGVKLAMDDFGMGHTSLRYINELPIDKIKIDKSLTQNMDCGANRHIVTSIVSLADSLGTKLVVEGIEDLPGLHIMEDLGCDIFQGYYFSKPLSPDAALDFIRTYSPPNQNVVHARPRG